MYYVYILQSLNCSNQIYTGVTSDLKERLKRHNSKQVPHTSKFVPWRIVWYGVFLHEDVAREFESYLKTGSGIAFARKRLIKHIMPP